MLHGSKGVLGQKEVRLLWRLLGLASSPSLSLPLSFSLSLSLSLSLPLFWVVNMRYPSHQNNHNLTEKAYSHGVNVGVWEVGDCVLSHPTFTGGPLYIHHVGTI